MANEPKMNFGDLPKENKGNIQPGRHTMVVKKATKELSAKGKPMLVLQVAPKNAQNLVIYDRFTLFDQNYEPESFGQYKLKNFLEAVDYIPQGDFTIEALTKILPDLEFSVMLEHEQAQNGKTYLTINDVESYDKVGAEEKLEKLEEKQLDEDDDEPDEAPKTKKKEPSEKVKAELEEDDEVV